MAGKYVKKKKFPILPILLAIFILLALTVGAIFLLPGFLEGSENGTEPPQTGSEPASTGETTVPATTQEPTEPPTEPDRAVVSTASFTVTGDLLMHRPVFKSCWDAEANDWIFDSIFTYVSPYLQKADYAVANLETTLCGSGNGYAYSGMPLFNCPDGIAISSLNAKARHSCRIHPSRYPDGCWEHTARVPHSRGTSHTAAPCVPYARWKWRSRTDAVLLWA